MEITKDGTRMRGRFDVEVMSPYRVFGMPILEGGKVRRRHLSGTTWGHNIVTDEGLNRILDVFFHQTTVTATWYCCLVESDTAAAHDMNYDVPVYTESTAYDEAARVAYNEAAASSQTTTNSANKAAFTINASKTMYGAFLASVSTKGDHAAGDNNVLFCYSLFAQSRAVGDDDVINLTYAITAADDNA